MARNYSYHNELNEDRTSQCAKGSADKPPRLASTSHGSWQTSTGAVVLLGCRVAALRGRTCASATSRMPCATSLTSTLWIPFRRSDSSTSVSKRALTTVRLTPRLYLYLARHPPNARYTTAVQDSTIHSSVGPRSCVISFVEPYICFRSPFIGYPTARVAPVTLLHFHLRSRSI